VPGFGLVVEYPEAEITLLSEEHGHVDLHASARAPAVGDVVTVIPNHACAVSNLHDTVTVRGVDGAARTWPVAARGKVR
jgi:D-serine deaminase-like pyridoxal phosphate-dependent protein